MSKFSPELKQRLQEYFADNYGININEEEAEGFLDSLASLYKVVTEISQSKEK